jgi:hypothetical protein
MCFIIRTRIYLAIRTRRSTFSKTRIHPFNRIRRSPIISMIMGLLLPYKKKTKTCDATATDISANGYAAA